MPETINGGMIPPTPAALQTVLEAEPGLVDDLNSFYPDHGAGAPPRDLGLDTADREWVRQIVGRHLARLDWPCNGDGAVAMMRFAEALRRGVRGTGWVCTIRPPYSLEEVVE